MGILELEAYAIDKGFDSVKFKFIDINGTERTGKWLDAYMGLFLIDDIKGFNTVSNWRKVFKDSIEFEPIE
jgi:hypothetical protein